MWSLRRAAAAIGIVLSSALLFASPVSAAGPLRNAAGNRPASGPARQRLLAPGAVGATVDGSGLHTTQPWRRAGVLQGTGDPRLPSTYSTAARAWVEQAWNLKLPDPRSREGGGAAGEVFRYGVPAGDLDGDGLEDVLVYEFDYTTGAVGVKAVRGTDGSQLWAPDLADAYDAFALPAGDLTGDGKADALLLSLSLTGPDAGTCLIVACVLGADLELRWEVSLLSGEDGEAAWSRVYNGHYQEGFLLASGLVAYAILDKWTYEGALTLPELTADMDGDGRRDVVVNVLDIRGLLGFAGGGVFAYAFGDLYEIEVATHAVVVAGAGGRNLYERNQDYIPGVSILYPVGDAAGGPAGDLIWETDTVGNGVFVCAFALVVGDCLSLAQGPAQDIELVDGGTLAAAWTAQREATPYLVPLLVDLTGDGKTDIYSFDFGEQALISGADGVTAWTISSTGFPLGVLGPVGGSAGADLALVDFLFGDAGLGVQIDRVDGATGNVLLSTTRTFAYPNVGFLGIAVYIAGNVDGDAVADPAINEFSYDFDTDQASSMTIVEKGIDGATLVERASPREEYSLPGGDLDGDGLADLVLGTFTVGDTSAKLTLEGLSSNGWLSKWSYDDPFGSDSFFLAAVIPSADQSGAGGGDVVYSRIEFTSSSHVVARVEGVEGLTGARNWVVG
jgi:hypothetical protein